MCTKKAGHSDKHECDIKMHFCSKVCYLNKLTRFCGGECSRLCEHIGLCICKKKKMNIFVKKNAYYVTIIVVMNINIMDIIYAIKNMTVINFVIKMDIVKLKLIILLEKNLFIIC